MTLYVEVRKRGGWGTDLTTSSLHYAKARREELHRRGDYARVIDHQGVILADPYWSDDDWFINDLVDRANKKSDEG